MPQDDRNGPWWFTPIISAIRRVGSARAFCATWEGVKERKNPKRKEVQPLLKAGSFAKCGKEHAGTRNSLCTGAVSGKRMLSIHHLGFLPSSLAPRITGSSGRASRV